MSNEIRIHFVLEGSEEELLFEIIKEKNIVDNHIKITYINAHGGGNVPYYFQDALQSDNYDFIFCVYDVDYSSEKEDGMYCKIVKALTRVLGTETEVNKISLCTNPNILMILFSGYESSISDLENISQYKKENTNLFNSLCSVQLNKKEYDASQYQLKIIKDDYIYTGKASLERIINRHELININYKLDKIGSNIIPVLKALYENDVDFFLNNDKKESDRNVKGRRKRKS